MEMPSETCLFQTAFILSSRGGGQADFLKSAVYTLKFGYFQ